VVDTIKKEIKYTYCISKKVKKYLKGYMERLDHSFTTSAHIDDVWKYLMDPSKLQELEPSHHHLTFISKNLPLQASVGLHIKYSISPKQDIQFNVENVYTEIEPKTFYATEIVNGIFDFWRFEHFLRPLPSGGTEIRNIIYFKPIVGELATIVDLAFTKGEINTIFLHRMNVIRSKWDN